jgi:hypothetical protein
MHPGGIRTHNLSRRAAEDLRLRPRGHWDLLNKLFYWSEIFSRQVTPGSEMTKQENLNTTYTVQALAEQIVI